MNISIDRRAMLYSGAALLIAGAAGRARACEAWATTLRVTHPWARATRAGATSAVVCFLIDEVSEDDRLIGATTPVAAGAQLAGAGAGPALDLPIAKGSEISFEETGIHLELLGLTQQLLLGRTFPLQLQFEKGGVVRSTLSIDQMPLRA